MRRARVTTTLGGVILAAGLIVSVVGCPASSRSALPDLLLASSEGETQLFLWSPGDERLRRVWDVAAPVRAIAVATARSSGSTTHSIYVAAGPSIYEIGDLADELRPVIEFESRVDTVVPVAGGELLALVHPPGDPHERTGPHWIHRLERRGDGWASGAPPRAAHPLAYDLMVHEDRLFVTWLQGRKVETGSVRDSEVLREIELEPRDATVGVNRRALIRRAVTEPGGSVVWLVESAVWTGEEVDPLGACLWRWDIATDETQRFPLRSRGRFQGGLISPHPGTVLVNGYDRLLQVTLVDGVPVERVHPLPDGHYRGLAHDSNGGRAFLVGSEQPPPEPGAGRIIVLELDPVRVVEVARFPRSVDVVALWRD